jgi:threonine dehydratase
VKSISSELLRPTSPTYSDGLVVQLVEQTPFARILDSTISRVVQVSEYDTTVAIAHALRLQSLLLEGSAATIIAALMTPELGKYRRGRILLVLTGGNISSNTVAKALAADVPDPGIRQELGLRHIINSVERHGAIPMKRNENPQTGKDKIPLSDAWKSLVARLGESLRLTKEKFDRQQILVQQLGLQRDSWSMSVFTEMH